jgi:hypothetical protein
MNNQIELLGRSFLYHPSVWFCSANAYILLSKTVKRWFHKHEIRT